MRTKNKFNAQWNLGSTYAVRMTKNIAILLLALIGLKNIFVALPLKFTERFAHLYSAVINHNAVIAHQMLSFFLGLLMVLLAYRLYKRVRAAWVIEMIALMASIILQIIRYHSLTIPILCIELFALVVLGLSHKDFIRKSDKLTFKMAMGFVSVSILIVVLNAAIGLLILKYDIDNVHNIFDALINSIQLLIFMDTAVLSITGKMGQLYADSLITINWVCILISASLLLKPLIYNPIESKHDKSKVYSLVTHYGQNPMAYLALENDKKYFFGKDVTGVCAYQIVGNVFVVCGDIICDEKDGFILLNEILTFCKENGYSIILLNITDVFMNLYRLAGFGILKYGEDACFKLANYNLAGGKVAKVRAAINNANKAGVSVLEYKPQDSRNQEVENQISEISKEWIKNKGGEEMGFMLGGTGLNAPLDRRYFYAVDKENKIQGFVVFLPYLSGKGYLADVTRRRKNSLQGILEKIIFEAFMKMKEEGVVWGNMGLSPLYNVADEVKSTIPEKIFNYIYENMNNYYSFKALHHAKEKYAPTEWKPRYLAFSPRPFTPDLAYAMVRVQVGRSLGKIVLSELNRKKDRNDDK